MLKAIYDGDYRSVGSPKVKFRYRVTGTEQELAEYEEIQGDNYRKNEEGVPLFFPGSRFCGTSTNLIITQNKRVIADMSKFNQAASLAEQFGGNFGQAIANAAATELLNFGRVPVTAGVATPAQIPPVVIPDPVKEPVKESLDEN